MSALKAPGALCRSRKLAMREDDLKGKIFVLKKLPTYHDYFKHLRDHRDEVRDILYSLLRKGTW
ncbi:MAG: hypothetical protein U0T56_02985 [Ferruginibacter sp.]